MIGRELILHQLHSINKNGVMMKDHIHKFTFVSHGPKKNERRYKPFIQLVLKNYTKTKGGLVTIAPDLSSESQIDATIHDLKKDLDRLAIVAKLELEKLNGRISN